LRESPLGAGTTPSFGRRQNALIKEHSHKGPFAGWFGRCWPPVCDCGVRRSCRRLGFQDRKFFSLHGCREFNHAGEPHAATTDHHHTATMLAVFLILELVESEGEGQALVRTKPSEELRQQVAR